MIDHWFKLLLEQYPELAKRRTDIREGYNEEERSCATAIIEYLEQSDKRSYIQASSKTPLIQW